MKVGSSICLTVHPDLDAYQAVDGDKSITLLGFMLDPDHPQANSAGVVDELLQKRPGGDGFLEHTERLGGRWNLIVSDGRETRLYTAWQDILTPYNNRRLLISFLSVDECFRRPLTHELYYKLISSLWLEVLCEPIHPPDRRVWCRIARNIQSFERSVRYLKRRLL
jgi:hypothetical protein